MIGRRSSSNKYPDVTSWYELVCPTKHVIHAGGDTRTLLVSTFVVLTKQGKLALGPEMEGYVLTEGGSRAGKGLRGGNIQGKPTS
jgi:hypothetical protein